jgi:hypothetical protein
VNNFIYLLRIWWEKPEALCMDIVEICEELLVSVYGSSAKIMKNFNMHLVET